MFLCKILIHVRTVLIHKWYVGYYCFKAGLYKQGIFHDISKFSYTEFSESIKYANGKDSPINVCKKLNGYSSAWFHHRGKNPHHYEMWIDNFDSGGEAIQMPFKCVLELICDYLGAGRAYMKDTFSYADEYKWWINKISKDIAMHYQTKTFVDRVLYIVAKNNSANILSNKKRLKSLYKVAELEYLQKVQEGKEKPDTFIRNNIKRNLL